MKYLITIQIWEIIPRSVLVHLEDVLGFVEKDTPSGCRVFTATTGGFQCTDFDPLSVLKREVEISIKQLKE